MTELGERIRRVEAIVIRHAEYGEADRILTLFTKEMGKVHALARGVRKEHSRKAGHLEPITCSTLMLAKGATFWIISQAETVDAFAAIKSDLNLTALAAYCLELVERFTADDEVNGKLYQLLKATLTRLSAQDPPFNVLRHFELRFLDLVGFRPELFHCVQCGSEIKPEDQFISFHQGGVLCPKCAAQADSTQPIRMLTLKYLRHFQRSEYARIRHIEIPPHTRVMMERLMQRYITYLAERKLNTPEFYRAIQTPLSAKLEMAAGNDKIESQKP